ncbi:uncharacterized protein ISCGN_006521 [Ixodes scapularis]
MHVEFTLIPKPGTFLNPKKSLNPKNLRSISLTSRVGKLFEHVVHRRLSPHIEDNDYFPDRRERERKCPPRQHTGTHTALRRTSLGGGPGVTLKTGTCNLWEPEELHHKSERDAHPALLRGWCLEEGRTAPKVNAMAGIALRLGPCGTGGSQVIKEDRTSAHSETM